MQILLIYKTLIYIKYEYEESKNDIYYLHRETLPAVKINFNIYYTFYVFFTSALQ